MTDTPPRPDGPSRARRSRWLLAAVIVAALCLVCGATAAIAPLMFTAPPLQDTRTPTQLADAESRFALIDGVLVHFKLYGSEDASQTVLLLHGFGASTFSWRDVAPALGERYRVVVMDRPGFGLTERPIPPTGWSWRADSPYSMASQATLAFGLLDGLSVERAVVVGHSQGAAVAAVMATKSPQRVDALVLVAPSVDAGGPIPAFVGPILRTPQGRRVGPYLMRGIAGQGTDATLERAFADPQRLTPEVLKGYRLPLSADDWDIGLWELSISAQPVSASERLAAIQVPTLIVIPGADRIVAADAQRTVGEAVPGAQVLEVQGQAHLYHEERPAEFSATLDEFIAGTTDGERP